MDYATACFLRLENTKMQMTSEQAAAHDQIVAAFRPGGTYLLTGYAGTGKTSLLRILTHTFAGMKGERGKPLKVAVTAPTHKAVAVLAQKVNDDEFKVPCRTIHSLLSLKPKPVRDALKFERLKKAEPITADVVVIDESSMLGLDLMNHIERELQNCFVLLVGDRAQLPPVNERESRAFATSASSNLATVIRQAEDNPILEAAIKLRQSQDRGVTDWSWLTARNDKNKGVFVPASDPDEWLRRAFTSDAFQADKNAFRYLCWTNARVAEINRRVRRHIFGRDPDMPFMPGELALIKAPVFRDGAPVFQTNQEAEVVTIEPSVTSFQCAESSYDGVFKCWKVSNIPSWKVTLKDGDLKCDVHAPRDMDVYNEIVQRLKDEAKEFPLRWKDFHAFRESMAELQPIYALTTHNSQGSTLTNVFVDVADIRKRGKDNMLEMQQLFYVAVTRPTTKLILLNR